MELSKYIYRLTQDLPESEKYGLVSQMRRAAVSVPSNIAEGWGRGKNKYFTNHLSIARGSLFELESQLILTEELGLIEQVEKEVYDLIAETGRMITGLINKIDRK
jgi:four helix bundle protein